MSDRNPEDENSLLIKKFRERDYVTVDFIYKSLFPGLLKFIIKGKGKREDAEDVFQDAMLIAYIKLDEGYEVKTTIQAYLFGICKNIWFTRLKKQKFLVDLLYEDMAKDLNIDIEQEMYQVEKRKLFKEKFELLSAGCKQVLNLFFEGKSMEQIAKEINSESVDYAKQRKFKCKEKLIKLIKKDPRYQELK